MLRSLWTRVLAVLLAAAPAGALTIDFEGFGHGDVVANGSASHPGWTLHVTRYDDVDFDVGVAFDTAATGTRDPDLEQGAGYDLGNLGPTPELGRILILQEGLECADGHCGLPDDWGRGEYRFDLDDVFGSFRFDLVDVHPETTGSIEFFLGGVGVAAYDFVDFLGGPFGSQSVVFGDHGANRVDLGELGPYDAFRIVVGGSGGIDNLALGLPVVVPEPGTAALLGLGLAGLRFARRRAIA